jgi:hypothetical protein
MTFTVVYDANVLYPNTLRDLLIRIAQSGTVQAKWTNAILDEMTEALPPEQARHPGGEDRAAQGTDQQGRERLPGGRVRTADRRPQAARSR